MEPNRKPWQKLIPVFLILVLVVGTLMVACDDDDDDNETSASNSAESAIPTATAESAEASESSELPFVDDPLKIACIIDWSGPAAMAGWLADGDIEFAEWYFNEKQGGVQVGDVRRPVEFIKYDTKGQVAGASAAAKKALLDDVVAITMGGVAGPFYYAVADVTDPENVLYASHCGIAVAKDYEWVATSFANTDLKANVAAELIVERLEAKTVGLWGANLDTERSFLDETRKRLLELDPDIEFVYEEYTDAGTIDYSPFLTAIKYKNPDVLLTCLTEGGYETIAKQIMEIGGWDDIEHLSYTEAGNFPDMEDSPGAQGWYVPKFSLPGVETEGQIAFNEAWAEYCALDTDWCKKYSPGGPVPLSQHGMVYSSIPVAIRAIELAGTDDREAIAQAALSGNLELDSALGYLKIAPDGTNSLSGFYAHLVDGTFVSCK